MNVVELISMVLFLGTGSFIGAFLLHILIWRAIAPCRQFRWLIAIFIVFPTLTLSISCLSFRLLGQYHDRFTASPEHTGLVILWNILLSLLYIKAYTVILTTSASQKAAPAILALKNILFPGKQSDPKPSRIWLTLTAGSAIAGLACGIPPLKALLSPYGNTIFAVLVGLVSLFSLKLLTRKRSLINYLLACVPFIMITFSFLISPALPDRDSFSVRYPLFTYVADSTARGHPFPQWISTSGGVRFGLYHITFSPSLPHRILGYYLYSIFPLSSVFVYKFQYIAGIIFLGFGWWLVLSRLTRCQYASYFGTLMIMMGGTGITMHQEQVLATSYIIPWFVLSILKLKENPRYLFPAVLLLGVGLTVHYPQIEIISMGLFVLIMIFFNWKLAKNLIHKQLKSVPALFLLFLLALLPSVYIFYNTPRLASRTRGLDDTLAPETYNEYLYLNYDGGGSSPPSHYHQYVSATVDGKQLEGMPSDRCSFFVGRMALIFVIIGIFGNLRKSTPIVVLLTCFALLTLGVRSVLPIPKALFFLRFPLIHVFRQWIHFFPMINFCLSALAALGFESLFRHPRQKELKFLSVFMLCAVFLQTLDLSFYDEKYLSTYRRTDIPDKRHHNLAGNFFRRREYGVIRLLQYKNRFNIYRFCPNAIPITPFLTNTAISVSGGVDREIEETCRIVSRGEGVTVTNIPPPLLSTLTGAHQFIHPVKCDRCVRHNGLLFNIASPAEALFVVPLNYDLNAKASIDGKETSIWRVNGALSGVLTQKGRHSIKFEIISDTYWLTVLIQCCLCFFVALFFIIEEFGKR